MNETVRYINKSWARKAMTILIDARVEFKTLYKDTGVDGYLIGLEYTGKSGIKYENWVDGEVLLDVIRTSV